MLHFSIKYNSGTNPCLNFCLFSLMFSLIVITVWLGKKMEKLLALLEFLEYKRPFLCWIYYFSITTSTTILDPEGVAVHPHDKPVL